MIRRPHIRRMPVHILVLAGIATWLSVTPCLADGPPLRVMSFNVRLGVAKDGENHWEKRRDLLVRTVQLFDPDLLGTQETWHFQADFLKRHLTGHGYVGWTRMAGKEGEQCGILYRKSRFELVDSGQFWLSETPHEKGSKSWDSSLPRIVTWVELSDREHNGRRLRFLNTHFDHRGQTARLESAKLLKKTVQEKPDSPQIITGDFNCGETSAPYQALLSDSPLVDTFRVAHPDKGPREGTFNGFKGTMTGARIDWIVHTPHFRTLKAGIDRTGRDGRFPSDHFPVTAIVEWSAKSPSP